jgi:hypothetical protein
MIGCRLDPYFEKIAKTIAGRPAHFELVTKDGLYILKQGDLILTTNGVIEEGHKYMLEVGVFYSLLGGAGIPQCFVQQKGILNFAKDDLAAYKPSLLLYKEPPFLKKEFVEPQFRTLFDYYRFTEIIQQKAMLKMVYD